jgi:hypothetical protein
MRPIIIGLFAAVMAAVCLPAAQALAATSKPATIDPDSKKKGMAAAPGVIQSAGLDCKLADARLMGEQVDPKTKAKSTFYEIACTGAEGFVVAAKSAGPPDVYTCMEATASKGAACQLPENADPKAGLAPLLAKSGVNCPMKDARAVGQAADHSEVVFEVACQDGSGYVIHAPFPVSANKASRLEPCLALTLAGGGIQCTLTDAAAQNAAFDRLVSQSGKACTVKDRKFLGLSNKDNSYVYEVACQDGKGYVLFQTASGALGQTIDCAETDMCQLTDTRAAKTEQASLYSKLARKAGFACDVSKYAPFQTAVPGHEVVELACSNRPDGAVAVFPASAAETAQIYDCAHSELAGYRCGFTQPDAADPNLTADLKKLGKSTCVVSGSRIVGVTADKVGYIEVACADGNPGFLITYALPAMAPKEAIACTVAKEVVGGCKLPTNSKKS